MPHDKYTTIHAGPLQMGALVNPRPIEATVQPFTCLSTTFGEKIDESNS
jgi:hypothetical protein